MSSQRNKYGFKLAGSTVLIIGGTSGVGFGIAEACVENHVSRLILSSSRQSKLDSAIERLKQSYPQAIETTTVVQAVQCDMGDEQTFESNIQTLFDQIEGSLDHIVFTAGDKLRSIPLDQLSYDNIKLTGLVRFFAPMIVAKHAASRLTPGPSSSITLTTGMGGDKAVASRPALNAYSAGLHGLVRALAFDLKPIRVNVVSIGATDTELWDTMLGPGAEEKKREIWKQLETKLATGKIAKVEDVVESYLFAMKDRNATGTVIRSESGALLM